MRILDTSYVYALNDVRDKNHARAVALLQAIENPLLLPVPAITEICYLLQTRLGHAAMRRFVEGLSFAEIELVSIEQTDFPRINEILTAYSDLGLDFVDATIIVMAERLNVKSVLTFDRRDFSVVRPKHCDYFELLP